MSSMDYHFQYSILHSYYLLMSFHALIAYHIAISAFVFCFIVENPSAALLLLIIQSFAKALLFHCIYVNICMLLCVSNPLMNSKHQFSFEISY
jgi:hypothetical protein